MGSGCGGMVVGSGCELVSGGSRCGVAARVFDGRLVGPVPCCGVEAWVSDGGLLCPVSCCEEVDEVSACLSLEAGANSGKRQQN